MRRYTSRKIIINSILFVGSLVFVIIILEIFFRVYYRDDYSVPSHRDWLFQKNWDSKFGNLNSLGHRDYEFSIVKPHDTYRILAIGDSFTFGEGIKKINDNYTEILENKLNDYFGTTKYEVLNVAQKGQNVAGYLSVLRDQGLSYQPDLVMIGFYINDIEKDKSERPKNTIIIPELLHWTLSKLSYSYWYTSNRLAGWKSKGKYQEYYLAYTSPDSDDWKRFAKYWVKILSLCKINNIKTFVVILPHLEKLDNDHSFTSVYRNVEELSKNNGAEVLNIFPAMKGQNPSDLWVGVTNSHPNEKAQRIIAEEIFKHIKEQKLVPIFR